MQSRRCDVNPICSKHEVHRWHLRATVTVGLLQQQQFLQPEQHDYPGHLTSTAFWSRSSCNRMTHAELSAFGSFWYRTALRTTFTNEKRDSSCKCISRCVVKIFLVISRFNALVEIFAGNSDYCRRVRCLNGSLLNFMLLSLYRLSSLTYFL